MKKILGLAAFILLVLSCGGNDDSDTGGSEVSLDRRSFLTSIAENQIIADYSAFAVETQQLVEAVNAFNTASNETTLNSLRSALLEAYRAFQPAGTYGFGPALDISYYLNMNSHPLDVTNTELQINNTDFRASDLNFSFNQNIQGLPAVDYLANGLKTTDSELLAVYNGADGARYKDYLLTVVTRINTLTNQVLNEWRTTFSVGFATNDTAERTGSFSTFINSYIEFFESRLRRSKVGFPSGQFTDELFPQDIEAVFMPEVSRTLLIDALDNAEQIFTGTNNSQGIATALTQVDRADLVTAVNTAFAEARASINLLNENLRTQIETDNQLMLNARAALQGVVILLKNDVVSALNVVIVFSDADGD